MMIMVTAVKAVHFSPSPPTVPERIGEALTSAYRWDQDWGSRRAVSLNFSSTGQRLPPKKNISWANTIAIPNSTSLQTRKGGGINYRILNWWFGIEGVPLSNNPFKWGSQKFFTPTQPTK